MQEYGWFHRNDFRDMITALGPEPNQRKLRLLMCACVRRLGEHLDDSESWQAIEATEDTADDPHHEAAARRLTSEMIHNVRARIHQDRNDSPEWLMDYPDPSEYYWMMKEHKVNSSPPVWAARALEITLPPAQVQVAALCENVDRLRGIVDAGNRELLVLERTAQCDLIRDIFGNPFQPVSFPDSWRTNTAIALSHQMYEFRDFGAMPILADALQDAGCDSDNILNHCRDANQAHVRGCWVIDLVLGKV